MSIAIIDPLLFSQNVVAELSPEHDALLRLAVGEAVRICRATNAVIPANAFYWNRVEGILRPIEKWCSRELRAGLDVLRQYLKVVDFPALDDNSVRMWGALPLFGPKWLEATWFPVMEKLLIGCAARNESPALIVRLLEGRNLVVHRAGRAVLYEKTRWRVYVQLGGRALVAIPCLTCSRNTLLPWSARFEEALPDKSDGGILHFVPPDRWWRRATPVLRTMKSKKAWIDRDGNGWAPPDLDRAYHWDLYLNDPSLKRATGLDQMNVVRWGAPASEGKPGDVHHVPKKKRARLGRRFRV